MKTERAPILTSHYLRKEKCDKLMKYVKKTKGLFKFDGSETPHGYYDIRVFYDSEREIPVEEVKKHYSKLLDIMIGEEKDF